MKLLPTKNELLDFFKYNKKLMIISTLTFFTLFLFLFAYNILSSDTNELGEKYLSQEEIMKVLERNPEEVDQSELEDINKALEQERYSFTVLVENDSQSFMNNQHVMKSMLVREDVVANIQESAGIDIEPTAELAINVYNEKDMLRIAIGTGNVDDNKKLAKAYYEAFNNSEIPFFDNKTVYQINTEPTLEEEESWFDLATIKIVDFSASEIFAILIAVLILSIIFGGIIAIIKSVFQKNIPISFRLEQSTDDKVIYLSKLSSISKAQFIDNMVFAISNPNNKKKLVLSQNDLPEKVIEKLNMAKLSDTQPKIMIAEEIARTNPAYTYEEVIVLVQQNQTEKDWYKNQRIQTEKFDLPVTIIQY